MCSKYSAEDRHYFDWAATAAPELSSPDTAFPFGNPSSPHQEGRTAREALESARARCAAVLGIPVETVYFTSGGTESNCIPLYSCLARQSSGRILASAAEHSSVSENLQTLERLGKLVGRIPLDSSGAVTKDLLSKTLEKYGDTRFAAIMAVNNETGTINDIAALRDVMRNREGPPIHFHCDMVQAAGKIPLDIAGWDIDSASLSAHKLGGPRGIGLLYLRRPFEILYSGGGQERGIRPGTENVAGALALAHCLENHALPEKLNHERTGARSRWKRLLSALSTIERCRLIPAGRDIDDERFSPYILQAGFKDVPGEVMTRALDDMGFAVSTGSACSSDSPERPVLAAMGVEDNLSLEGIRISQGWSTTDEEIDLLLDAIAEVLKFL
ncbi:MAG: cysteine desulfurase [Treponema sp.]|jgi:cysteine desulfurase|nr:cysteine desulfurase [Treponema sp.]